MINLESEYPSAVEPSDANYPSGGFKNETSPGLFDGTPYEKAWANDVNALMQSLIKAAGITLSGSSDTVLVSQLMQGLLYQNLTADLFAETGAVNAYVLSPLTNNYAPHAYKDGAKYRFTPGNTNTGASTVNISSLGAKNIFLNGAALITGVLLAGIEYEIVYDLGNDRFNLLPSGDIRTDGTTYFKHKMIDIGDWDMDATASITVAHGLTAANIRSVDVHIRDDTPTNYYPLDYGPSTTVDSGWYNYNATNIVLFRETTGLFDSTSFDATSYNRGYIVIEYKIA